MYTDTHTKKRKRNKGKKKTHPNEHNLVSKPSLSSIAIFEFFHRILTGIHSKNNSMVIKVLKQMKFNRDLYYRTFQCL